MQIDGIKPQPPTSPISVPAAPAAGATPEDVQSEKLKDRFTKYLKQKTEGLGNELVLLKQKIMSPHGRTFLGSIAGSAAAAAAAGSVIGGPLGAVVGCVAGVTAGAGIGALLNTPIRTALGLMKHVHKSPEPGLDVKIAPPAGPSTRGPR